MKLSVFPGVDAVYMYGPKTMKKLIISSLQIYHSFLQVYIKVKIVEFFL
jgi:hypothetical protein